MLTDKDRAAFTRKRGFASMDRAKQRVLQDEQRRQPWQHQQTP